MITVREIDGTACVFEQWHGEFAERLQACLEIDVHPLVARWQEEIARVAGPAAAEIVDFEIDGADPREMVLVAHARGGETRRFPFNAFPERVH